MSLASAGSTLHMYHRACERQSYYLEYDATFVGASPHDSKAMLISEMQTHRY